MDTIKAKNLADHLAECPFEIVTTLIGGKWKLILMHRLLDNEVLRFGELKRAVGEITQKMLTNQLRELEKDGLVARKVYSEVPPKVEYSLTELGQSLRPLIQDMKKWGMEYRASQKSH